ncbi:histidine-rich glycoprotein-like [Culex pipiens pallens]|uniref:histidine-rich glycoprotein-like n=1 Tax=Culex pipiens pallens TaxID=42434 RepID=UPI001954C7CF|nr:histidine-rich glycoprotein-like [Culex pipiens pallens]XP_039433540.1 histidine-rich glycoprotein-like [Culex pipiens pallens]XP_052565325.1 histidine-rich glycoprotein-like [Culex pipiens pallens]
MAQFVTHIQPTLMEASQGHMPHHHGHQVGMQHSSHLPHSGHNMPSPPTGHHHHLHGHGHGHHGAIARSASREISNGKSSKSHHSSSGGGHHHQQQQQPLSPKPAESSQQHHHHHAGAHELQQQYHQQYSHQLAQYQHQHYQHGHQQHLGSGGSAGTHHGHHHSSSVSESKSQIQFRHLMKYSRRLASNYFFYFAFFDTTWRGSIASI